MSVLRHSHIDILVYYLKLVIVFIINLSCIESIIVGKLLIFRSYRPNSSALGSWCVVHIGSTEILRLLGVVSMRPPRLTTHT